MEILQNFVAFSEYMNFKSDDQLQAQQNIGGHRGSVNLLKLSYTQYVLISKGPISKTSQISGFSKQWLVKFSKLSNNLFCSRFLSNPLVNFFNLSKSKLLLCVWQNAIMCKTLKRFNVSWLHKWPMYIFVIKQVKNKWRK